MLLVVVGLFCLGLLVCSLLAIGVVCAFVACCLVCWFVAGFVMCWFVGASLCDYYDYALWFALCTFILPTFGFALPVNVVTCWFCAFG